MKIKPPPSSLARGRCWDNKVPTRQALEASVPVLHGTGGRCIGKSFWSRLARVSGESREKGGGVGPRKVGGGFICAI